MNLNKRQETQLDEDMNNIDESNLNSDFEDDTDDDLNFDDFDDSETSKPMEKHSELLKQLTDFNPFLKNKFHEWLAMTWNEKEKKFIKNPYLDPIMNLKCANWLISFISTYTRNNNIITNITKEDYNFLVEDVIDVLWFNIGLKAEEYGIVDYGNIARICTEVQHAIELVLMGAGDGKYNDLLKDTHKETSHNQPNYSGNEQNHSQGWFKKIFG